MLGNTVKTADVHGRREPVLVAHPGVIVLISSGQIITSLTRSLIGEQTPLTQADRKARPVVYHLKHNGILTACGGIVCDDKQLKLRECFTETNITKNAFCAQKKHCQRCSFFVPEAV